MTATFKKGDQVRINFPDLMTVHTDSRDGAYVEGGEFWIPKRFLTLVGPAYRVGQVVTPLVIESSYQPPVGTIMRGNDNGLAYHRQDNGGLLRWFVSSLPSRQGRTWGELGGKYTILYLPPGKDQT
jgi:hypothetical protein